MLTQLVVGLALAAIASFIAYRAGSLTRDGAAAATLLGAVVFGLGGWQWAVLLLAFFITSSALTRAFRQVKSGPEEKYAKGGRRDAAQVLSNGGLAGIFVLLHAAFPVAAWPWMGYGGALAAVTADTWATELGVLNASPPRLITRLRERVEKGTSGGVSVVGTAASLLAGTFIALLAAAMSGGGWPLIASVTSAGLIGSIVDSYLGATVQAIYFCPLDKKETEKHPFHTCGTKTVLVRGWKWMGNDLVNAICSAAGAILAITLVLALS